MLIFSLLQVLPIRRDLRRGEVIARSLLDERMLLFRLLLGGLYRFLARCSGSDRGSDQVTLVEGRLQCVAIEDA